MSSIIQLDQKLVDSLVKEHLHAAVLTVLADKKEIMLKTMCDQILNVKVDEGGNVSSYSSSNKYSWIEYALNKELRTVIKECVVEQLQKIKPDIERAIKTEVSKSGTKLAKAIMAGFTESLKVDYKFNIGLSADR